MTPVEVAVIVPLEDPRGDVVEHLRTWTQHQTLERDRFRVLLSADGKHPDFERRVAGELAEQDAIVSAPGASLMGLYDAAARDADAPVILLTEAHVRAEPGCLASVAAAFAADPELDVATLKHHQNVTIGISQFSARWFERAFGAWDDAGWTRLNTTAVAIRSETYIRTGGLDSRLGLYAPSLMSAQLDQLGARIIHLDEAEITHELEHEMDFALELGGDFARGECVVRREQDPEFCRRHFGSGGLWERRLAYDHESAGVMVSALRAAIRSSPRDAPWLTRELLARMPARLGGTRPRRAWESTRARAHQALAGSPALPREVRWRSYVAGQEATVRAVQLEEIARETGAPPALDDAGAAIPAAGLDDVLAGTHALERVDGQSFRWTEPVALLRINGPEDGAAMRIETGGLRGAPLDYIHSVHAGTLPLPEELISGDAQRLEVQLPPRFARAAAESGLVVICRPLVPSRAGIDDGRRLGMPVVSIKVSATAPRDGRSRARSTAPA